MARYAKKPEKAVKSDTRIAKEKIRSGGYAKDTSVDAQGGEEP